MKDYARFDDIENPLLKAFNRVVVAHNISDQFGAEKAKEYINGFEKRDLMEMAIVTGMIKEKGLKKVKQEVNVGVH